MRKTICKIAIPSYQRSGTIKRKTLAMLESYDIDPDCVHIFVADSEEAARYKVEIGSRYKNIIVAKPGIRAVRNFMQLYFEPGEWIVFIDDDIESIEEVVNPKQTRPVRDLVQFIEDAIGYARLYQVSIWGVYLPCNPFFMKRAVTLDLRYIPAGFYGLKIDHQPEMLVTVDDKEDFERSILYYSRDGKVMRFNYVSMVTKCYTEKGGMQVERTLERNMNSCLYLAAKYPHLCEVNTSKKSRYPEIRLRDKTR